ncbi:LON peptidase substrate-binding domain-containing protein [Maribacter litopenaei]|uniref:LON peptidase substrate-binding domain-containing protein n=1 Tax=Maribacter litopenaei TaxID=2976127 RepID=A0ABY5Y9X0_9FLAO|nr:LON peptidase substrate-binding domain-containing protein [Maribacter litopenaei]UWX55855.1 LON peptidase substrate-binding domain-containing protein [Maribacter litopenaei]
MKLPLFPLKSVFFPGDTVPLHIFEPRYKQLIQDCREEAITFGIPVLYNNKLEYGTEVQLVEVVNTYDGGEMDVVCVARQVFKVVSFEPQMGGKLYPGGQVDLLEYDYICPSSYKAEVVQKIRKLYEIMELPNISIDLAKYNSFVLAHKIGLSYEQEFDLLKIPREKDRLDFILNHLVTTINVLSQVERARKIIELNGHFKNFDPLDFKNIET